MKKIVLAEGEDWIRLIVDGVIVAENHSLHPGQVLDALGIKYELADVHFIKAYTLKDAVFFIDEE